MTARRWAELMWALCVAVAIPVAVLIAIGPDHVLPSDIFAGAGGVAFLVLALTFASVGVLIAIRVPGNSVGPVFCLTGFACAVQLLLWQYADVGLHPRGQLPLASAATTIDTALSEATAGLLGLSLLLFPDGRLPSRRWRPAYASLLLGMALLVCAGTLRPGAYDQPFAAVSNPFGIAGARSLLDAVDVIGWLFVLAGIGSGAAALVVRRRRARGVERRQLELVLSIGSVAATAATLLMATWLVWPHGGLQARMAVLGVCFATFPLAAGFAILRRGLYGIELAINRTLVYGSVTTLLAAVFALTTVLLGIVLGRGSPWATAGATAAVALLFRPVSARVRDAVDRRFSRARYDALRRMTAFLDELRAGLAAPEQIEPLLRDLVADPSLELRFFLLESRQHADAHGAPVSESPPDGRGRLPVERGSQPVAQVLYDSSAVERPLLRRVVEAGGLAIEIARLHVELRAQLAQVEESRARIVTAANEERRRIERDLHDGAQQRLVSIGLALRHAQHELGSALPERAGRTLDGAVAEVAIAIDELRGLALGLPPSQLDSGLAPAFRELARRAPVPVDVSAPRERFGRDVEAAAYFIGCEGLTNAVKHAGATRIALTAGRRDGQLVVSIADDGVGGASAGNGSGLRGLGDRVAALGGTLRIDSAPGAGTTLIAELPCGS